MAVDLLDRKEPEAVIALLTVALDHLAKTAGVSDDLNHTERVAAIAARIRTPAQDQRTLEKYAQLGKGYKVGLAGFEPPEVGNRLLHKITLAPGFVLLKEATEIGCGLCHVVDANLQRLDNIFGQLVLILPGSGRNIRLGMEQFVLATETDILLWLPDDTKLDPNGIWLGQ